jgi:hypothetical protein
VDSLESGICATLTASCCDEAVAAAMMDLCAATCCWERCFTAAPSTSPPTVAVQYFVYCDVVGTTVGCLDEETAVVGVGVNQTRSRRWDCDPACNTTCWPNPCENGGACFHLSSSSHECSCPEGYSGSSCEIGPCDRLPGDHCGYGNCIEVMGHAQCDCSGTAVPRSGERCELSPCEPNPCLHNGTCSVVAAATDSGSPNAGSSSDTDANSMFVCECRFPFSGPNCANDFALEHFVMSGTFFPARTTNVVGFQPRASGTARPRVFSNNRVLNRTDAPDLASCKHMCAFDPHCLALTFVRHHTALYNGTDPVPAFTWGERAPGQWTQGNCTLFATPFNSETEWFELEDADCGNDYQVDHFDSGIGPELATDGLFQPQNTQGGYLQHGVHQSCEDVSEFVVELIKPSSVHTVRVYRRCGVVDGPSLTVQRRSSDVDGWENCGQPSNASEVRCEDDIPADRQYWERQCNGTATAIRLLRLEGLEVASGSSFCQIDANGCATDGAGDHGNNEACTIRVNVAGTLTATEFDTQSGYDFVTIGGTRYQGRSGPHVVTASAGSTFAWYSDRSVTKRGWTICLTANQPSGAMITLPEVEVYGNPIPYALPPAVDITAPESAQNLTAFLTQMM